MEIYGGFADFLTSCQGIFLIIFFLFASGLLEVSYGKSPLISKSCIYRFFYCFIWYIYCLLCCSYKVIITDEYVDKSFSFKYENIKPILILGLCVLTIYIIFKITGSIIHYFDKHYEERRMDYIKNLDPFKKKLYYDKYENTGNVKDRTEPPLDKMYNFLEYKLITVSECILSFKKFLLFPHGVSQEKLFISCFVWKVFTIILFVKLIFKSGFCVCFAMLVYILSLCIEARREEK